MLETTVNNISHLFLFTNCFLAICHERSIMSVSNSNELHCFARDTKVTLGKPCLLKTVCPQSRSLSITQKLRLWPNKKTDNVNLIWGLCMTCLVAFGPNYGFPECTPHVSRSSHSERTNVPASHYHCRGSFAPRSERS